VKKAFRDAYNRELALLYERSAEFARDYPGIADRLGGLVKDNLDPAVAGLIEGTAFLAARVQLKMEEEFRTFTAELLNQVFPDALAPTPSVMLVKANVPFANKDLAKGLTFPAHAYLDARFVDADERVSCRFRLAEPLCLWPLAIKDAVYHGSPAPIMALGEKDVAPGTRGGLVFTLMRPVDSTLQSPGGPLSDVQVDALTFHLTADMGDAAALYEQMLGDVRRISLRWLDKRGDPVFARLDPTRIEQVGFADDLPLFPRQRPEFSGFARLRELFVFPRRFLGFRLTGLRQHLARIGQAEVQVVIEFGTPNSGLVARLRREHLVLNAATAVNLFEDTASQVRLDRKRTEYVVTPDQSPITHYEVQQILSVQAHYAAVAARVPVFPLYALPPSGIRQGEALFYTTRRKPRRMTEKERRFGTTRRYRGTETYISVYEPPGETEAAQRLQIRTLNSNRHVPEELPLAASQDDFFLCDDITISLAPVAGPTRPRESLVELDRSGSHRGNAGDNAWRLISYLALSRLGLDTGRPEEVAASLKEMLSLFIDPTDAATEAQLRGILGVETRPIVRSIRRGDGFHPARGIEVRLTFDEAAFEGAGISVFGAVLDRFFAEHAAVNSFTQTVLVSTDRGVVLTFPPRTGAGPLL
jgi:type VI secretion system protein ImpG